MGFDTSSVGPFQIKDFTAHQALVAVGVVNLEGLLLDPVSPGLYEVIALPLRFEGLDASSIRDVLRALPSP